MLQNCKKADKGHKERVQKQYKNQRQKYTVHSGIKDATEMLG